MGDVRCLTTSCVASTRLLDWFGRAILLQLSLKVTMSMVSASPASTCQAIIPFSTLSASVRTSRMRSSSRFSGRNPPACIFHNL